MPSLLDSKTKMLKIKWAEMYVYWYALHSKRQITKTLELEMNGQQVGCKFRSGLQWIAYYGRVWLLRYECQS